MEDGDKPSKRKSNIQIGQKTQKIIIESKKVFIQKILYEKEISNI